MLGTALAVWGACVVALQTSSPIVVVLSGSMEPAVFKGDLLVLHDHAGPYETGEILVFRLPRRSVPIVHRVVDSLRDERGGDHIVTKGDANPGDDLRLYAEAGIREITGDNIIGRVFLLVPQVGYATIAMNERPMAKVALLGGMVLFLVFAEEE